jgi:hypothetical protein
MSGPGHIIVTDGTLTSGWQLGADVAWAGESAAHRIHRLCSEQGIPIEIIGDRSPHLLASLFGDLGASQAMGPQLRKTFPELLAECAAVDMGILSERSAVPGLVYRCRRTLEDQDPRLALTASSNEITNPLAPTLDDQRLRNDVTVTSAGGSSAQAVDAASIAEEGLYDVDVEIAGVGGLSIPAAILADVDGLAEAIDDQNILQAGWRLALGTEQGLRYPAITVDLSIAPHLIDAWLAVQLGDRITLGGLPVQHPISLVELLVEQVVEMMTPTSWRLELTCSPGDVWLTGSLVE